MKSFDDDICSTITSRKQTKLTCLRFGYCVTFDISQTLYMGLGIIVTFGYCVTFDISQTSEAFIPNILSFGYCVTFDISQTER